MIQGGTGGPVANAAGDVSREQVIDELRRILSSEAFVDSPRSRDFLAFVVRETLEGRGQKLKERTVARGALDKPPSFDPRSDSSVRVQAGRVRSALERYYSDEGGLDAVRIELPKGSYLPVISALTAKDAASTAVLGPATLGPGVAVVRFTQPDDGESSALAVALTESLVSALAAFPGIRVVGPIDSEDQESHGPSERRLGTRLDVRYVIRGSVVTLDDKVTVTVRLVDAASGEVVWSETSQRPKAVLTGITGMSDLVSSLAATVGDYGGAVLRHEVRSGAETTNPVVWAAMLEFYEGLERTTPESALRLLSSLLSAHELEPQNSSLLSMLASTESFLALYSPDVDRAAMTEACESHARAALALDPNSGHAHLVLGVAAFSRGNQRRCLEHLRLAIELSPGNPSILYGAAWYFGMAGEWELGVQLMRESVRLNPASPTLRYMYLAIDDLMSGDYAAALIDAMRYPYPDEFWQPVLLGLALDGLGHRDEALAEMSKASLLVPDLPRAVRENEEFPAHCVAFLADHVDALLAAREGLA